MSTTFKVGDRVKLTGDSWEERGMYGEIVIIEGIDQDGEPLFSFREDCNWRIYANDFSDYSATLVEPAAPPPDTRKRLREITDLADGDSVVIAGVEITYSRTPDTDGPVFLFGDRSLSVADNPFADMLVDEVRRKPKTKKRLVFDEVVDDRTVVRDLVRSPNGAMAFVSAGEYVSTHRSEGRTVYRLVEETEVPR